MVWYVSFKIELIMLLLINIIIVAKTEYLLYSECELLKCGENAQCLADTTDGYKCVSLNFNYF